MHGHMRVTSPPLPASAWQQGASQAKIAVNAGSSRSPLADLASPAADLLSNDSTPAFADLASTSLSAGRSGVSNNALAQSTTLPVATTDASSSAAPIASISAHGEPVTYSVQSAPKAALATGTPASQATISLLA